MGNQKGFAFPGKNTCYCDHCNKQVENWMSFLIVLATIGTDPRVVIKRTGKSNNFLPPFCIPQCVVRLPDRKEPSRHTLCRALPWAEKREVLARRVGVDFLFLFNSSNWDMNWANLKEMEREGHFLKLWPPKACFFGCEAASLPPS